MGVADFSGYATKANLKCSDGRTITPQAFQHMDGVQVPLVWQHGHKEPANVLGHAVLEAREDGVYCQGYFNETPQGQTAKALVQHEDIKALSIFANQLVEKSKQVLHGMIREVSLCLAGANPGAFIDNVTIAHSDGSFDELDDAAIISSWTPLELAHADNKDDKTDEDLEHATVKEVYDTLTNEQKDVVNYMIGAALQAAGGDAQHSDDNPGDPADTDEDENLEHQEGTDMSRNVFEQQNGGAGAQQGHTLSHDDIRGIVAQADKLGSMKEAVEEYALAHGINDIEVLFPEARNITSTPEFNKRRTEWVSSVLGGTHKTPFSRIKTITADITMEEARAKGYIKGTLKKEEWFSVTKRTTGPTTVYKKQKLDRDDVIDITDFDVVAWMKGEMRLMLEEELARAILISDGRDVSDEDKVKDPMAAVDGNGIRSILHEHELFATTINVSLDGTNAYRDAVESIMLGMEWYKGTGTPTLFTTLGTLNRTLLTKDGMGRRLWRTKADLAAEMGVDNIVTVEVMEDEDDLYGIVVNLQDYNIGADKGGEVSLFDDFDIDYNQLKYLIETRISGALTKIKSALVVKVAPTGDTLATPVEPGFVESTGVVTIPTVTGVVYKDAADDSTLTAGAQTALAAGESLEVYAVPASGYYFGSSEDDNWTFTRPAA